MTDIINIVAANLIPTNCDFCLDGFDEDTKCPRILNCKHIVCTHCVNLLIRTNIKICPTCKKDFEAKKASDLRVDEACLEKATNRANDEPPSKRPRHSGNWLLNPSFSWHQNGVKNLLKEVSFIQQTIKTDNELIRTTIFKYLMDAISQNNKAFGKLENTRENLENSFNEMDTQYARMVARNEYLHETQEENPEFVKFCESSEKIVSEEQNNVETRKKEVQNVSEKTEIILDVLKRREQRQGSDFPVPGTSRMGMEHITDYGMIHHLPEIEIKRLVKEGRLFAVKVLGERRRFAKISQTENGDVFLHHLNEENPPRNSFTIPHRTIMEVINPRNVKVFIHLTSESTRRTLGNIIIRLTSPSCPRAKNFILLCTGGNGVSYANSKALGVAHKGKNTEFVRFGDYQLNTGEGGQSLVELTGSVDARLPTKMWQAGMVTVWAEGFGGETTISQFKIYTHNSPRPMTDPDFGMVEEGLPLLIDAISNHHDIRDVFISDCGIILPDVVSHAQ